MKFNKKQQKYLKSEFVRKFGTDDAKDVEDKEYRYDDQYGKIYKYSKTHEGFVFLCNADNSDEARYYILCQVLDEQGFDYALNDLS